MTILIKNILLIDGSGQPPAKADVLIKNEKIAAIGSFPRYQADTIIDGMGAYLAPGFIDSNTNSDRYLTIFTDPGQEHFLKQGVTTIIGGQDGISLAPLIYGSLDLQKFWTDPYRINVDWHTVKEFSTVLRRRSLGVNFGTLVGHSTLRHAIIGNDFRDLTSKELSVFQYMVEGAMQEGAFGVSFDLQSPIASLTPAKELRLALELVEKHKGLAAFKIRNGSDATVHAQDVGDQIVPAVSEIINLSKETGVRAQLSNFSALIGYETEYQKALDAIEENAAVADVYFTLHPFAHSIIPIVSFLPVWAQRGGVDAIVKNMESLDFETRVIADLQHVGDDLLICDAPEFEYLVGKTLGELSNDRGTALPDTLFALMHMTKLRATLAYKNLATQEFNRALVRDRSMIASSSASFEAKRAQSRYTSVLADAMPTFLRIVSNDRVIPIETAIRKITSIPAQRLGIKDRGLVREGYFADLVLFRDTTIETVFVNGSLAIRDGVRTDDLNGKVLDHANK